MSQDLYIGEERGFGIARIQFQKKFPEFQKKQNKSINKFEKFSEHLLEKMNSLGLDLRTNPSVQLISLTLFEILEIGGICISKENIVEKFNELQIDFSEKKIIEYLKRADSILVEDYNSYYFKKNHSLEKKIAEDFSKRLLLNENFNFIKYKSNFLSTEQLNIVNEILSFSLSILSGGPGTGKTKTILSILENAIQNGIEAKKIAVLSPTGKATKRLNDSIQKLLEKEKDLKEAKTIHRYLEYSVHLNKFKKNSENQVEDELIILDESSMVDLDLMESLLKAISISKKNKLILVGDPNQLLSVNKGAVFNDLCELNKNHFKLTKTFRQLNDDGNEILQFSESILNGKNSEKFLNSKKEFFIKGVNFYEVNSEEELKINILDWKNKIELVSNDYQILTPFHETKIGTRNLNQIFESKEIKYKAILNSNLYEYNIFNGEVGEINLKETNFEFTSNGKKIELPNSYLDYFELGYVITIHKSQGSEYEHVLVILPFDEQESKILNKRIFYTAITRAKKSLSVFGAKNTLQKILTSIEEKRISNLEKRIKSLLLK